MNQHDPRDYSKLGKPLARWEVATLVLGLFVLMPFAWLLPRKFQ